MNPKAKGSRNERKSMRLLEAMGYLCTKSAASLGMWDLVCIGSHDVLLVQVKSNAWPGKLEREAMEQFVCPSMCRKIVHRWDDRKRYPKILEL